MLEQDNRQRFPSLRLANSMRQVLHCSQQGAARYPYHSDADGVIELVHEDADDSGGQQEEDQGVLELHVKKRRRPD